MRTLKRERRDERFLRINSCTSARADPGGSVFGRRRSGKVSELHNTTLQTCAQHLSNLYHFDSIVDNVT